MDDQHFDDYIKKKAEAYQESGVDPAALADFRNRLDRLPSSPWYVRYRNIMGWAAVMALFTLVNVSLVWYFTQNKDDQLQLQLAELKVDQQQLQELKAEIQYLKSVRTDTVFIYKPVGSGQLYSDYPSTHSQTASNTGSNQYARSTAAQAASALVIAQDEGGRSFLRLGRYQELSEEVQSFVAQSASISQDAHGNLYLPLDRGAGSNISELVAISPNGLDGTVNPLAFADQVNDDRSAKEKQKLSGKIVRALDKQRYSGWGFQTGLEMQQFKSIPRTGDSKLNSGIGVLGEFILSPRWRVEMGVIHSNMRYEADGFSDNASLLQTVSKYPGYEGQLGELNDLGVSSTFFKLPANLKYFYPIASNSRLYASAGLTPYVYVSQRFNYQYTEEENSGVETFVASKKTIEDNKLYFGSANVGLGAEFDLNERFKWQVGLFYEKGLSDFGVEANRLNTLGLKTSVWLRVK
ncbi:MAG: outer membrane beta-barrel protein [Cyclobacteriaceae bacterium]